MDKDVWAMVKEQGLPVLGICYGMQEMAFSLGGRVAPGQKREYGKAMVHRNRVRGRSKPGGEALWVVGRIEWRWGSHINSLFSGSSGPLAVVHSAS